MAGERGTGIKTRTGNGGRNVNVLPFVTCIHNTELEALGDDFLGEEEDSSYLDVPDPPTGIPDDKGREQVRDRI